MEIDRNHLFDQHGSNLSSMRHIDLSYKEITRYDAEIYDHLKRLGIEHLLKTLAKPNSRLAKWQPQITRIEARAFQRCTSATRLELQGNKLRKVEPRLFAGLVKLEKLELRDNLIFEIDSSAFRCLTALTILELHSNRIVELASNVFEGLEHLVRLTLHGNLILRVDRGCFGRLNSKRIELITLFDNRGEFSSFVRDDYVAQRDGEKFGWELELVRSDCVFGFDEFLGQFDL